MEWHRIAYFVPMVPLRTYSLTHSLTHSLTDRQTDRQTDRILIARPRLHSMQRGKNCNLQHLNDVVNLSMSASKKPVNVIIFNNAL